MSWGEFDARMRVFETASDVQVLPGVYMVARLDGRSFTRLTKTELDFEAPFDARFRDLMHGTVRHLFEASGIRLTFGTTHSDEMSLLFARDESSFGRNLRKLLSVLAGEASAMFTHLLGRPAVFDCRIAQLPRVRDVVEYFVWRSEDAHRNALSAHNYWRLRNEGHSGRQAARKLEGASVSQLNEMLFARGVNFNDLPVWQKRGSAFVWRTHDKSGVDPRSGVVTITQRRHLETVEPPRSRDEWTDLIGSHIDIEA